MSDRDPSTEVARSSEFTRHRGPITCAAAVPGRQAAVTSGYDSAVGYVDLQARTIELLGYHDHLANRITVDAAGLLAATSSSDFTVKLWDLEARQLLRTLRGHSDDVEDFAFIDERRGVSVSRDRRILIWDIQSGAILRVIEGHERDVLSVVYADGRIYSSGDDMTLRVWDAQDGRLLRTWGPFEYETDTCAIDPLRQRAILGCDDGVVRVFDAVSGADLAAIPAHASGIKIVRVSPVNGDIFSAAYDRRLFVWDAATFACRVQLESHPAAWERSFNWSPDGRSVLAGTFDGTVVLWDAESGAQIDEIGERGGNACLNDVAVHPDRRTLCTVSDDGHVRLGALDASSAAWIGAREPGGGRILANAVTIAPDGRFVVTGNHDQSLRILELAERAFVDELVVAVGEGPVNSVKVAHHPGWEGRIFAACYSGAIVSLAPDGSSLRRFGDLHGGAVKSLRLHPTRTSGISCSADGVTLSWDFEGARLDGFPGHTAIVDDVDVSPSGELAVTVSRDFTLNLYAYESGKLLESYMLGYRSPKAVCFFDERTAVVSNYWGELIRIGLEDGLLARSVVAVNGISALARVDEAHLVATSYDGAVYLVRVADLAVVNQLREMVQRVDGSLGPALQRDGALVLAGASER